MPQEENSTGKDKELYCQKMDFSVNDKICSSIEILEKYFSVEISKSERVAEDGQVTLKHVAVVILMLF
jgi:hypothetical protein